MGPIDRFTRDEVSAKIWWPTAMLLVVLVVLTFPAQGREEEQVRSDAVTTALAIDDGVLAPQLEALGDPSRQLSGPVADALSASLADVLDGPAIEAVRVWSPEGALLYSTNASERIGSAAALNEREIETAKSASGPVVVTSDRTLTGEPGPVGFHVYVGVGDAGVVGQVAYLETQLLDAVSSRWLVARLALGASALLVLALALLSMREPVARIGAGVPFYPTSVPAGMSVLDADDAAQIRQSGQHVRRRIAELEARLRESEERRNAAEGDLQRALSMFATDPRQASARPAPEPVRPIQEVPASAEGLARTRDQGVGEAPAEVPAAKAEVAPTSSPTETPAAAGSKRKRKAPAKKAVPKKAAPERTPEPAPAAEPVTVVPEPEPVAVVPEPEPEPEPVAPDVVDSPAASDDVVVVPEPEPDPEPEPVTRRSASIDEGFVFAPESEPIHHAARGRRSPVQSDEEATDVLERLVTPVGAPAADVDDASLMRAKLARTAALKKPGSRERREQGMHHGDDEAPA